MSCHRFLLALSLAVPALSAPAVTSGAAGAASGPDLDVAWVRTGTSKVGAFGSFTVRDKVVRTGAVPAGVHVEYALSKNRSLDEADIPLLGVRRVPKGAGKDVVTTRLTTYGLTPPGSYRVIACADPGHDVRERVERNNCAATKTTVKVTSASTGRTHDVTTTLATNRAKSRVLFLHDVDRFGTEQGKVSTTGPDGTTYTLTVPRDAALVALPITMVPITSVSGLAGSPRVVGVKITPEHDLTRGATLTITPGTALSEKRALPATYDGDGSHVRLTPMTSRHGEYTFAVTHLGGFLLVEGARAGRQRVANHRRSGSIGLRDLFSWTPSTTTAENAADAAAHLRFERQQQLLGSEADLGLDPDHLMNQLLQSARAEIAATGDAPTIGHWDGLLRFLVGVQRQMALLGLQDEDDLRFGELLPLLPPVFSKVVAQVHDCDDGMGDAVATVTLRAGNDLTGALFDLPADADTACTRFRAHVSVVEHDVAEELETAIDYSAGVTWPPKDLLDFSDQSADGVYTTASFHDACQHGEGPVTAGEPWVLSGLNVDWDALFQRWTGKDWEDPDHTPFRLDAYLGSAEQEAVLDDPGCDEATTVTYGPSWAPEMELDYVDGVMSGERIEDDNTGGTHHLEIRYDLTAVR